jgi:phospholipid/cholesterol/gamma-HCH transport system permease protein
MPSAKAVEHELIREPRPRRCVFEPRDLTDWDSSLVTFVTAINELCRRCGIATDRSALPGGLQRLVRLAETVPEKKDAQEKAERPTALERIGAGAIRLVDSSGATVEFLGHLALSFVKLASGKARYRRSDLYEVIQQCGANALGIVALISYLVGTILAFMGAVQLQQFGASIYVADLVAIGMVREMGAMMTAIIMSGRTGAAFAARLGTMKVTQEIDAFTTMGVSPMEFLVLPRVLGLVLMMPLLCLYADFLGILGGATVGAGMMGISLPVYFQQTVRALHFGDLLGGLSKGAVYGALVAFAGCLRGFQCGNSSSAVGDAATRAVVTGIVLVVVACGIFAVIFHVIGI